EKHYVRAGRIATVILFVLSSALVFVLQTAQQSFNIILQIGAGTGLLYLLRWFWWRVTAWCEITAMIASFGISLIFAVMSRNGKVMSPDQQLLLTVIFTTILWLLTAYLGPQTDLQVLKDFYTRVHPFGPGWNRIRIEAGISKAEAAAWVRNDNISLAIVGWVTGVTVIWSGLFLVGSWLYGRVGYVIGIGSVFVVSAAILIRVVNRLWK
ncbi:MAG: Na+:solute symporter, partial [Bryobacteraceae bacterium]